MLLLINENKKQRKNRHLSFLSLNLFRQKNSGKKSFVFRIKMSHNVNTET